MKLRIILSFVLIVFLAGAIFFTGKVSYYSRLNIRSIKVQGASHVPELAVRTYADSLIHPPEDHYLSPSNIFWYRPRALERAITSRFPWIETTRVERDSLFGTDLVITLTERSPFALWCLSIAATSSPCYEMDKHGYIFAPVSVEGTIERATSYQFSGGLKTMADVASPIGDTFAEGNFSALFSLLQFLSLDGHVPIGIQIESDADFSVPLATGYYLKASFKQNPENLVKNLQLILSSDALRDKRSELRYIDLRFGDRVYYAFKESVVSSGQDSTLLPTH